MVSPLCREWFVMVSIASNYVSIGMNLAYPSVLTATITGNNTDLKATKGEASWIASTYSIASIIGLLIVPALAQMYGRKFMNFIQCALIFTSYVSMAFANNVIILIFGRVLQGLSGTMALAIVAGEYYHPKRRGFFLNVNNVSRCVGILLCHSLVFILSWRQIAWLGASLALLNTFTIFLRPESPTWLACKGRYDECIVSFESLRGKSQSSKRELKELISAQEEIRRLKIKHKSNAVLKALNAFRKREFMIPLSIMCLMDCLAHSLGKYYLAAYLIQIMSQLAEDRSQTYYYSVAFDGFKVLANITCIIFVKLFKRRTLLFGTGALACFLLFMVCIFDYLEHSKVINVKWITPSLLIAFAFVSQAIISIYFMLMSEIMPVAYKSLGASCVGVIYALFGFLTLKFTSNMLDHLNVYGTFGLYCAIAVIILITLYFILPETKDRSLQHIENDFMNIETIRKHEENQNFVKYQ